MKLLGAIVTTIAAICLLIAAEDLPNWGDVHAPVNEATASRHYIMKTYEETTVPNFVTAVLADYRGYDTMFETVVVFIAGMAIMAIVGFQPGWQSSELRMPPPDERKEDPIVRITCRILMPMILMFGLYVIAHGHHSPGGGFQGGVIYGAALILYAISTDLRSAFGRMTERMGTIMSAVGVLIYSGTGLLCFLLGGNFIDYSQLAPLLGVDRIMARSHGIFIVEIGVGFAVMAVMVSLYYNLSSAGRHDEGL